LPVASDSRLRRVEDELHALEAEALAMQRQGCCGNAVALNSLLADIRATMFRQSRIEDLLSEAATTFRQSSASSEVALSSLQSSLLPSPRLLSNPQGDAAETPTTVPPLSLPHAAMAAAPVRDAPPEVDAEVDNDVPPTLASVMVEIASMAQEVQRTCQEIEHKDSSKTSSLWQDQAHVPDHAAESRPEELLPAQVDLCKDCPYGRANGSERLGCADGLSEHQPPGDSFNVSRHEANELIAAMQTAVGQAVGSVRSASLAAMYMQSGLAGAGRQPAYRARTAAWLNAALNAAAA